MGFLGGPKGPTHANSGGTVGMVSNVHNRAEGRGIEGNNRSCRQMSDAKYKEKRSKGLCFACDERYMPNHVCKNKQNK